MWAASSKKAPNALSRHTKRKMVELGRAHLSFGMTPTFQKKKKEEKSVSYRMTTQDIRNLFAYAAHVAIKVIPKKGLTGDHQPSLLLV